MAIERGDRVRAESKNGEIFEGTLYEIALGVNKENPTQACIFISEDNSENMQYGQVSIFCNDLKSIEKII